MGQIYCWSKSWYEIKDIVLYKVVYEEYLMKPVGQVWAGLLINDGSWALIKEKALQWVETWGLVSPFSI